MVAPARAGLTLIGHRSRVICLKTEQFRNPPQGATFAFSEPGRRGWAMDDPLKLRELAAWYREFAEKTGNPSIWEARLRMAEDLEREAERLEQRQAVALETG
jgi:hypothetical protein